MYITNSPEIALITETSGVDRVFVDMEYIGKSERQGGMDTVQSHHTFEDIVNIRRVLTKADLMVRCNPIHNAADEYVSSEDEIDEIIKCGADIIMLPYFKSAQEVKKFVQYVGGRAKTLPLVETPEAVECIDDILQIEGIDEIFVGLNDLSIGYGKKFMFELLADGTVEMLCNKFKEKGIPYGFGGIASLGKGTLPSEKIIGEHYRLGSECVILSRSFCDVNKINDLKEIERIFKHGLRQIRDFEKSCEDVLSWQENKREVQDLVKKIVEKI